MGKYERNKSIQGWNQTKLLESRIAIVGYSPIFQHVVVGAQALGIGYIDIINVVSCNNEYMCLRKWNTNIKDTLEEMDIGVDDEKINFNITNELARISEKPNLVIDTTNDYTTKLDSIRYCEKNNIKLISGVSNLNELLMISGGDRLKKYIEDVEKNEITDRFEGYKQGNFTSGLVAAIILEEIRKNLLKLNDYEHTIEKFYYNMHSLTRLDSFMDMNIGNNVNSFNGKKIAIIGVGGIGNFLALEVALENPDKITIIDNDTISNSNFNRQPYLFGRHSENKVELLANNLKKITKADIEPRIERFDNNTKLDEIDVIFCCPDNYLARKDANDFAVKYKIPLINTGSGVFVSEVYVYVPGKTGCLNHPPMDIDIKIKEKKGISRHCNPSLVIHPLAAASMAVGEARPIFCPKEYGEPIQFYIQYHSEIYSNIILGARGVCNCHEGNNITKNYEECQTFLRERGYAPEEKEVFELLEDMLQKKKMNSNYCKI